MPKKQPNPNDAVIKELNALGQRAQKWATQQSKRQPTPALLKAYANFLDFYDQLEEEMKRFRGAKSHLRETVIPERFENESISSQTLVVSPGDKRRFVVSSNVRASILAENRENAHKWLKKRRLGSLISPVVNASTLSALAKDMIENGKELPDDLFKTYWIRSASVTRVKPTKK